MSTKVRYLIFDYETYSAADLPTVGAFEYAVHSTTEILCAAFRIGTKAELSSAKTIVWTGRRDSPALKTLVAALLDPNIQIVAHNSFFEMMITEHVLSRLVPEKAAALKSIPLSRWHCTAAGARAAGLPGKLELVARLLGFKNQKNMTGHRVMLKLSKPRKPTKLNSATRFTPSNAPEDFQTLYIYCADDIGVEVDLFLFLPALHTSDRQFWESDQRLNKRGFLVDRELVVKTLALIDIERARLERRLTQFTKGQVTTVNQHARLKTWLDRKGVILPDLQAATIQAALKDETIRGRARKVLELRAAGSKAATAKYNAFERGSRYDGRLRDFILFYGAHTGRHAAVRVQPQNMFRSVFPPEALAEGIKLVKLGDHEAIRIIFGSPLALYASLVRSCIVAPKGHTLDVGDFSTIEVRVLFWLAGHRKGIDAIKAGRDLYIDQAADIYDEDPFELELGYELEHLDAIAKRQLGKETILGCGFGMGVDRFVESCESKGIKISKSLGERAVSSYRTKHSAIPAFWEKLEEACFKAVRNPKRAYRVGRLICRVERQWLTIELPIGRKLYYYQPRIQRVARPKRKPTLALTYMTFNSKIQKVVREATWGGKLVENVVQATARDVTMTAMLRLEKRGLSVPVLPVHDEIAAERKTDSGGDLGPLNEFLNLMQAPSKWTEGLPIQAKGWSEPRYRK